MRPSGLHKADDHPNATLTAAPALFEGTLYVPVSSLEVTSAADPAYECCTFRGSVLALEAASGTERWKTYSISAVPAPVGKTRAGTRILGPSGAPVWNTPAIDPARGLLYIGTGENYSSPANDRSDAQLAIRLAMAHSSGTRSARQGDAWNVACMLTDNPNCPHEVGPDVDFGAANIIFDRGEAGSDAAGRAKVGRRVWHRRKQTGRGALEEQRSAAAAFKAACTLAWRPTASACMCRSRT